MDTTHDRAGRHAPGKRDWAVLVAFIVVCIGMGALSSLAQTPQSRDWYDALTLPAATPPDWAFPVAWNLIYVLMAVAGWLVWRRREQPGATPALILFAAQLGANVLWVPAFFGLQSVVLGFYAIVPVLIGVAACTVAVFRVSRPAGLLFLPYLGWVTFAAWIAWRTMQLNI
jgi:tryptophan-rich sensory protein